MNKELLEDISACDRVIALIHKQMNFENHFGGGDMDTWICAFHQVLNNHKVDFSWYRDGDDEWRIAEIKKYERIYVEEINTTYENLIKLTDENQRFYTKMIEVLSELKRSWELNLTQQD